MVSLSSITAGLQPTNKLYLNDSYLGTVETTLLRYVPETRRSGYFVTTDTIMHPKGGAQPSDTGTLESANFKAVVKKVLEHSGVVVHYGDIKEGTPREGEKVSMMIAWEERYRVMRLHTAGHIVDYAVVELLGRDLLSSRAFHGPPESFVEYIGRVGGIDLASLERISNVVVKASKRVYPVWVPRQELLKTVRGAPNLARLPELETYRVIVIDGVNAIPCGGTHVANTAEVRGILIKKVEEVMDGFKVVYDVADCPL
ncbi:Alanine--tRNA ligase [Candidatus Calditenuaceae archaeon HR02]|nr:Alanine--tRNA ligase [Candidatus Calditenuaceae archaeon HR02]